MATYKVTANFYGSIKRSMILLVKFNNFFPVCTREKGESALDESRLRSRDYAFQKLV